MTEALLQRSCSRTRCSVCPIARLAPLASCGKHHEQMVLPDIHFWRIPAEPMSYRMVQLPSG